VEDLTAACPVKYIEDMERSEFNRGAGKAVFPFPCAGGHLYLLLGGLIPQGFFPAY
jgi:hypothetical protein